MFPGEHSYVVVGSIGLAESFTFATLGVINKVRSFHSISHRLTVSYQVLMSNEDDPFMYLYFFLTLSVFSLVTIPIQRAVSSVKLSNS